VSSGSLQALKLAAASRVLTPECFLRRGRLHGYSLLAVLRRAVEGVPKAIERKNVRGMGTFCRFSLKHKHVFEAAPCISAVTIAIRRPQRHSVNCRPPPRSYTASCSLPIRFRPHAKSLLKGK